MGCSTNSMCPSLASHSIISSACSLVFQPSLASTRTVLVGATSRSACRFTLSSATPTFTFSTGYRSASRTFLRIMSGLSMPMVKEVTWWFSRKPSSRKS